LQIQWNSNGFRGLRSFAATIPISTGKASHNAKGQSLFVTGNIGKIPHQVDYGQDFVFVRCKAFNNQARMPLPFEKNRGLKVLSSLSEGSRYVEFPTSQ
jgi:hypothetical protein